MPDRFHLKSLIYSSIIACSLLFGAIPAFAIAIEPAYDSSYDFTDLGSVPGVPTNYGGLTFKAGDPTKLLIGGDANTASGKIYEIEVNRDGDGHVTGFNGTATAVIDAPYNDGGVLYGPGGVLFLARWQVNELGQVKPGSNVTDKVIDMDGLTDVSLSALNFPPPGFPGDGRLKLAVYDNGKWYDTTISPDGTGTYNLGNVTNIPGSTLVGDGPEGWIYVVPGSPVFDANKRYLLLSAYSADEVVSYELDVNGDPITSTRSVFMSDLQGAEGATIDPLTGDFLFSTFGGENTVVVVKGFLPPPALEATISINDLTDTEGDSGTKDFNFTVTRSGNTTGPSSVDFATADDTATEPSDYAANSGTVNFAANETTKTVTVVVNGDTDVEPNETFNVDLSNCVGCNIADGQGVGTIVNDDAVLDTDGDGVPDAIDQCPTVPGPATNNGCPVTTEQPVGGELLGIDATSLLIAGAFGNSGWILSVAAVAGAGIVGFLLRRRLL